MRAYGRIESGFWQNPKVRPLGCDAKMLLLYLYACPHGNSVGCFVLPAGYIVADLEYPVETVSGLILEFVSKGFIERDEASGLTRIVGWFGHNKIENGNVARAAMRAVEQLPSGSIKSHLIQELAALGNKFVDAAMKEFRMSPEAVPKDSESFCPNLTYPNRAQPSPPLANGDAIRVLSLVASIFGKQIEIIGWSWTETAMLLDAGFTEREIVMAAEKTKASGVVPKKLAKYLRPVLDDLRGQSKPAAQKPKPNFAKIAGTP